MSLDRASAVALAQVRRNLLAGLDRLADHLDAGTFHDIAPGRSSPPSQSGHLTLALLEAVDTELDRRSRMEQVAIVDVDGTIALMGKGEIGRRGPYDWDRVGEDDPNQPIIDLVRDLRGCGYRVVFLSGRDEVCRPATESWLMHHAGALPDDAVFMRAHKDNRSDDKVKLDIYRREIEPKYVVKYVLDDRDQVVRMWRGLGLTVLQVAPGDF